jgi:primary-amine oxidase
MTDVSKETSQVQIPTATHPLEPLTSEEIRAAVSVLKEQRSLSALVRFVSVTLHEPKKSEVLAFQPGDPLVRRAFLVLLDKSEETTATDNYVYIA